MLGERVKNGTVFRQHDSATALAASMQQDDLNRVLVVVIAVVEPVARTLAAYELARRS